MLYEKRSKVLHSKHACFFLVTNIQLRTCMQHSLKFAILFVCIQNIHLRQRRCNIYNISNIIYEIIKGCKRIHFVNNVSIMQSDCSGSSIERCSIYPVPGPFQSMSVVFRRHITFQTLSMCERSRATAQGVFTLCCM